MRGTNVAALTASGNVLGLLADSSNGSGISVGIDTASAGARTGTVNLIYATTGTVNGVSNGLAVTGVGSQAVEVNGNVFHRAAGAIQTAPLNFGTLQVGQTVSQNLVLRNTATGPNGFVEDLNAGITSNRAPVTAVGSFGLLAPGATNGGSLQVALAAGTAGDFTDINAGSATIALVSDASNIGGCDPNWTVNLASQQVSLSGKVYTAAISQLNTSSVTFLARKGDVLGAQVLNVSNIAATTALNETLRATLSGVSGPFTGGAAVSRIAAGASSNIVLGLNTASSGVFAQIGTVTFASQNPDMADASAGANGSVDVSARINKLADAVLSANFKVRNVATGTTDNLNGSFDVSGVSDFDASGFASFAGLVSGAEFSGLHVEFDSAAFGPGFFAGSVFFDPTSAYSGLTDKRLAQIELRFMGRVLADGGAGVPGPAAITLMLLGLLGAVRWEGSRA